MPEAQLPQEVPPPGPESVSRAWTWAAVTIAGLATFGVIARFRPEIDRMRTLEAQVRVLAQEEAAWQGRLTERAKEHRRLTDSPTARSALARDVLDLRRPGETIFRPLERP